MIVGTISTFSSNFLFTRRWTYSEVPSVNTLQATMQHNRLQYTDSITDRSRWRFGRDLLRCLKAKAQQDVRVYFLYDAIGSHRPRDGYISSLRDANLFRAAVGDARLLSPIL